MKIRIAIASILITVISSPALAKQAPATLPATEPATRPRYQIVVPPGFQRISVEGRALLVRPDDAKWVSEAVESAKPTTRPSTMPTDLLERLLAQRAQLKQRVILDLGISDPATVDKFFDERLIPMLKRLEEMDPQIIYLVTPKQTLIELVKGGWQDPHFYYNRVADDVAFNPTLSLSLESEGDENLLPAMYDPSWSPEERRERLQAMVSSTELSVMTQVAMRAQNLSWIGFTQLISEQALEGLAAKPEQQWFTVGVASVLAAEYVSQLIGVAEDDVLRGLAADDPRNPVRAATIDLLHPADVTQLRPQYVPAYADAFNRKSVRAARSFLRQAGEGAAGKVVAAWKKNPPADGNALLELIKQTTNVDVSADLRAQ